ncbi:hypothetical protein E2C01_015029 [Portunus trituberculatus]|uniref:Uncharacterized protein n=1 Tax=Portunus trituberculatus TaxID=210409 RepID=A0A5B7DLQ7_PORTR|nr:hypothetical protein [Portunus trituberculatus]
MRSGWSWWCWVVWWAAGGVASRGAAAAAQHPVLASLRDEPASPRPSLRSQLRGAATDARGRAVVQIDSSLCTNEQALGGILEERRVMRRVRRLLRGRPLPATHLRLSFDVRWDSAAAFLQGVPVSGSQCLCIPDGIMCCNYQEPAFVVVM